MNIIPLPRFNAATPEEEIRQIENYLFSLVDQINQTVLSVNEIEQKINEVKK